MKIAFVTGCLEPGCDGVGDYTATLAAECVRRGHQVRLLSLAEKPGGSAAPSPTMLRLAPAEWRADVGAAARRWLDAFAPDWVSLQFVPYSYDPRGFFAGSIEALARIMGAADRRHIFFHEVWIGSHQGAPLKARVSGWWQRRAVAELLRRVAPQCMHTSIEYYRLALARLGHSVSLLPMFGSIPPLPGTAPAALPSAVPVDAIVCGHFGTLHPHWEVEQFLCDLSELAQARGRSAALVAAGSLGYGRELFARVAAAWQGRVHCVALGRLDGPALAAVFARFDFAVTSVPWNILGKSSSAATLREHGLPVVVTAAGSGPRFTAERIDDAANDPGFVPYFRDRGALIRALEKTPPRPGVVAAADVFLKGLDAA
ncbi:MAG TPA: hypothetical protein VHE61_01420 [Opitutaceae bacterium]|nr:hypothetical protein [Opitutaceae bacterium]